MTTEDRAEQTVRNFIARFNEGDDADAITALFAPNAQFWGTLMPDLGEGVRPIRDYFAAAFARRMGHAVASITQISVNLLSDDTIAVAGRWQIARVDHVNKLRFSIVLNRQNGHWLIVQFHSSPRPTT
jgi:uncharacterized protein (TIGR02246 family)